MSKKKKSDLLGSLKQAAVDATSKEAVVAYLQRKKHGTPDEIARAIGGDSAAVMKVLQGLQESELLLLPVGDDWRLQSTPAPFVASDKRHEYTSRSDGTYLFGFAADAHVGSKYFRGDVLNDLFKRFAEQGVDRVFNSGNWIEGEARFNTYDVNVHGMDAQLNALVEHWPEVKGISTYAVAGDDHEGWYGQAKGIDIGRHAEAIMRESGRDDWFHLGFMESYITLKHAKTGVTSQMLVMHPGGGSAYATSYKPQKIVESLAGGEKPAVILIGHYHKLSVNLIRNVWAIQCGTQQDQTPFMRKKGIDAHVGGGICQLEQDPETGAIIGCRVEMLQFFNTGYYQNRWSHGGPVNLPTRKLNREV